MTDFSDDIDYEMDSAFLAEVDAIEATIEPTKATPARTVLNKPTPLASRTFSTPHMSKQVRSPFTPAVPRAPPPGSSKPFFRPTGRSISASGPSTTSKSIGNAVRSALAASASGSQASSTNAASQNEVSSPVVHQSSDVITEAGDAPPRQPSVESISSPPARERAISVHSSDDYSCYDIPDDAFDEIDEIAESALTGPTGPPASSARRQMNLFGGVVPQTPGASGSGSGAGARAFSSSATSSAPRTTSKDGLFGRQHHRQKTKSWDYVKAAESLKKKGKARAQGPEDEDDEELEQFPDLATPPVLPGMSTLTGAAPAADSTSFFSQVSIQDSLFSPVDQPSLDLHHRRPPTKMKCPPDPKTISNWIFPLNKEKRDYQFNIIHRALLDNTLVSLPTGLGKTFIAGSVMLNFYNWFPTGKVVFVAPTKPLVAQQVEACHESCGIPGRDAIELTGTVGKTQRIRAWEERRVFYMTPQTFINDLKDGTCDARDIVLVVIDEAHRATGAYAYVTIVHYLMAHNPFHRILALSATPGKNSETVQSIVDGLHISRIEIRDENSMDLQKYLHKKHTDIQIVEMNEGINRIKKSLVSVMEPLLKSCQGAGCLNNADPETMSSYRPTAELQTIMASRDKNKMRVVKPLQYLGTLARAMGYLIECSVAMSERCLVDFYNSGKRQFQSNWDNSSDWKMLKSQLENYHLEAASLELKTRFPPHPKMVKLNEILGEHFGGPDSEETRVMVFTNFRESVDEIVTHLNSNNPGKIRAHRFIGQAGGKSGEKGMNQKEQIGTIGRFKAGEFNVLVATSIGEEGLDIGEIDLIVCYDAQKAPVRMLQRIGRTGRKRDGKVVVLLAEIREEKNWDKAKESYRDVQQAIIDGSSLELFDDAARMIPDGIQIECVEKKMDIEPYDREVHGNLSGKRLRTKTESSASAKKRKRSMDPGRNIPEGALTGFITAASLNVQKKGSKKKASSPRPDGLDSDDDAIEAGVFAAEKQASESDEDTPARKRATKAKSTPAAKTPKAKPRKSVTTTKEDPPEPPTLSQPPLVPSPKRVRKPKATPATSSKRSFSSNSRANATEIKDTREASASSDAPPTLKSSPLASPRRPQPFPLGSRKPAAPPSSPINLSSSPKVLTSNYESEPKPATTPAVKHSLSWVLHSDSDVEILNSTPPRSASPEPAAISLSPLKQSPSSRASVAKPLVFTSPASPKLDPPTDSPDRSFPVRRAGRSTHISILDSSPPGSPSGSQAEEAPEGPSTPPRRRIRRGRRPSPVSEAEPEPEVATKATKKGKGKGKVKHSILDRHRFLETEAQYSGSDEDMDGNFDPEGVENEYDREFVRDSPLTQAPAGYNQRQFYAQSLMTQVPGGGGPLFASGPVRYGDYLGRGGAFAGAGLGNRRRPGVSSSPVREGPASQYVHDSFVVDDEEIEYETSSDVE